MQGAQAPNHDKGRLVRLLPSCSACLQATNIAEITPLAIQDVWDAFKTLCEHPEIPNKAPLYGDQILRAASKIYVLAAYGPTVTPLEGDLRTQYSKILEDYLSNIVSHLPKDIILITDDNQRLPCSSLLLSYHSKLFDQILRMQMSEGSDFVANYPVNTEQDSLQIRLGSVSKEVLSLYASLLAGEPISQMSNIEPDDIVNLLSFAEYMEMGEALPIELAKHVEQPAMAWMFDRLSALEAGSISLPHALPLLILTDNPEPSQRAALIKEKALQLLSEKIQSTERLEYILSDLSETDRRAVLEAGLDRIQLMLAFDHLSDEELFHSIASGTLGNENLSPVQVRQTCGDILVKRLPQMLVGKKASKNLFNRIASGIKKKKDKHVPSWVQQFEQIAHHINRYDYLNIESLNTEQVASLVNMIAPHATHLNLSNYQDLDDSPLWKSVFPKLVALRMSNCPDLEGFQGGIQQLPVLKSLDLSNSPHVRQFDNAKNRPQLTQLDVHGCERWQDHNALLHMNTVRCIDVRGCGEEFVSSAISVSELRDPGNPFLVVIS